MSSETSGLDFVVSETQGKIERAYIAILGREAEPGGLNFWLGRLADGMALEDIYFYFLNSPERDSKYPAGQSDSDFLDQLYQDAFKRAPDAPGKAYWMDRLAKGTDRVHVTLSFAHSTEMRDSLKPAFALNILHINDHHSHLDPGSATLNLGGEATDVELGGFPRVVTKFDELASDYPDFVNVAKLHAGDAISGTLYYSLFEGEADAAMMNEICFDAFALGNHEFDDGDDGLAQFLGFLDNGDCDTDVLAANVKPEVGTPLQPTADASLIAPYVIEEYPDGKVGYVGIDIASKTKNSSSPFDSTEFLGEVATAQAMVDELTQQGIDKIVLITHYQFDNDLDLASMVDGVDVIIGGDSHSLLGDFGDLGLNPVGSYPTQVTDKSGNPVCIGHAWQYSALVGELQVEFDANGVVSDCDGTPHLLLGDTFERDDADGESQVLDGDALAAVKAEISLNPVLSIVEPDADALATLKVFSDQVDELAEQVIGVASEDLCLERIPGQGRSAIEGCSESTAVNGGDIQQIVADAFRARSFEADIALQNSGGVRIDVPAGDITIATAYEVLPFSNTLVNLNMTGQQIHDSIEEGVANAIKPDGSTGAYPYASGLRWDMDLNQPEGSRASNLEFQAKGTTEWVPLDMNATYAVVSNNFQAAGGDGYNTMGAIFDAGDYTDTLINYAQGLIDYIEIDKEGVLSKPTDYSTQSFVPLAG